MTSFWRRCEIRELTREVCGRAELAAPVPARRVARGTFYSPRERAALEWTETVTLIREGHVPDHVHASTREHFSEEEIVDLTPAVVAINGWNRIVISFRSEVGTYRARKGDVQVA